MTAKDARALSGDWYNWFVQRHLDQPSGQAHWKLFLERLTDQISQGVDDLRDPNDPSGDIMKFWERDYDAREPARAMAADWAETSQFLHSKRLTLDPTSRDLFLDYVCRDLYHALHLLISRGDGNWSTDTRPQEFPRFEGSGGVAYSYRWKLTSPQGVQPRSRPKKHRIGVVV